MKTYNKFIKEDLEDIKNNIANAAEQKLIKDKTDDNKDISKNVKDITLKIKQFEEEKVLIQNDIVNIKAKIKLNNSKLHNIDIPEVKKSIKENTINLNDNIDKLNDKIIEFDEKIKKSKEHIKTLKETI